jgi:hypothetical protein
MAVAVRSRAVPEIVWEKEDVRHRSQRRHRLAAFDFLLTQLEECNLKHGGRVPETLRAAIARAGVPAARHLRAPDLIEAIFEVQEHHMLQQLSPPPPAIDDLRRRIAV